VSSRSAVHHPRVSVTPKRLLAERLLRSVAAGKSVPLAQSTASSTASSSASTFQLRPVPRVVEVRCVFASKKGPPRSYACSRVGPRAMLTRMVETSRRTARAIKSERLAGRFAGSTDPVDVEVALVASVVSKVRPR
jgi:hypothetical protein